MSQVEPENTTINDSTYTMYMLPPMTSHNLLVDLLKMVGPGLGPLLDSLASGAQNKRVADLLSQELTGDFFSKAATALFGGLDQKILDRIIKAFAERTHVDGKPLNSVFDFHFTGKLDEMYRWLVWGMRVQWGKSLGALVTGLGDRGAQLATPTIQASQSPSTSTGSDGDQ